MKLVFFGSGAFGLPTLQRLAEAHELLAVVTQPDKPAGRKRTLQPTPIGSWAVEHAADVPLFKPDRVNEEQVREEIRGFDADAWVVIAFGQKLGKKLLADRFAINLHASLLPRWRGAAPINAAVVAGDGQTGNSVITLADEMDAGFVLGQSSRPIEPQQTAGELHDLLSGDGPELVESVLAGHAAGSLEFAEQDSSLVTLAGKMGKADGWLDFGSGADACRSRVHGLNPWPGVTVEVEGSPLKMHRVESVNIDHEQEPGTLFDAQLGLVACGSDALKLITVQPEGKKPMPWTDFQNGRALKNGARFDGRFSG